MTTLAVIFGLATVILFISWVSIDGENHWWYYAAITLVICLLCCVLPDTLFRKLTLAEHIAEDIETHPDSWVYSIKVDTLKYYPNTKYLQVVKRPQYQNINAGITVRQIVNDWFLIEPTKHPFSKDEAAKIIEAYKEYVTEPLQDKIKDKQEHAAELREDSIINTLRLN